jgi:hypothetical protein
MPLCSSADLLRRRLSLRRYAQRALVVAMSLTSTLAFGPAARAQRRAAPAAPAAPPAAPVAPAPAAAPAPSVAPLADSLSGPAKEAYESAKLLYRDGDFKGAMVKFQAAYELAKDARLKWNIAACEKNLRHYSRVKVLVSEYLEEGGDKLTPEDRQEAKDLLKTIEPFTALLRVDVAEPGAQVFIDDVLVGTTPLDKPVELDIGVHKLRVQKDGFESYAADVPVGGAPEVSARATLKRIIHEGRLSLRTTPADATVMLDGRVMGKGGFQGVLPSGAHQLKVYANEFRMYQSDVVIEDNKTRSLDITLEANEKKGIPSWVWVVTGGVVVAGAASVGAYFLFKPGDPEQPVGTFNPGNAVIPGGFRFR